jgi:hypothetical protein
MTPKTPPKPDDKAQSERFIETARDVGADRDTTTAGDGVMGRLAKMKPNPKPKHSRASDGQNGKE